MRDYAYFWQWCLKIWRAPDVEGALLELQTTHDAVVLELLMATWLAVEGLTLDARALAAMRAISQRWVQGVVVPLRQQRVAWRLEPDAQVCRAAIKELELRAEKVLGELLYSALQGSLALAPVVEDYGRQGVDREALLHNLSMVLDDVQPPIEPQAVEKFVTLLAASADRLS